MLVIASIVAHAGTVCSSIVGGLTPTGAPPIAVVSPAVVAIAGAEAKSLGITMDYGPRIYVFLKINPIMILKWISAQPQPQ